MEFVEWLRVWGEQLLSRRPLDWLLAIRSGFMNTNKRASLRDRKRSEYLRPSVLLSLFRNCRTVQRTHRTDQVVIAEKIFEVQ